MRSFHFSTRLKVRGQRNSSLRFSSSSFTIKMPSSSSSSWERSAKKVKNVDTTNKYLEHIRDVHDPSQHLKTLEDELRGTMGRALGKQGEKILRSLQRVEEERVKYVDLMLSISTGSCDETENPKQYPTQDVLVVDVDEDDSVAQDRDTSQEQLFQNISFKKCQQLSKPK